MTAERQKMLARARAFLNEYAEETGLSLSERNQRLDRASESIRTLGTYTHTFLELQYGARVAWRNNARCIGRLLWDKLVVRDRRHRVHAEEIFEDCVSHLVDSTNGGKIVPMVTIFPEQGVRIVNSQLVRYADDPNEREFVALLGNFGWEPSGQRYEILPLMISDGRGQTVVKALPPEAVLEVTIEHPEFSEFNRLGLRWHALPAMSNQVLEMGGIHYPCSPFSGWYMGTEIAARNLADRNRYNLIPDVAKVLGRDTRSERSLWRDRSLVELNRAVLYSFEKAGVSIVNHHKASRQFQRFIDHETRQGREVNADWSWIVPPMSGSLTEVFHTPMRCGHATPDYLSRTSAGLEG